MPISLRALKTFTGRKGESRRPDNLVEMGGDFNVADQNRADYLERAGLAGPLIASGAKKESVPLNKMEQPAQNKAASEGPLRSAGGETGGQSGLPLSPAPDRVHQPRGSRKPRAEQD